MGGSGIPLVWRRVKSGLGLGIVLVLAACGREGEMPEQVEMPDTMEVMRAMRDPAARDAMLDTMPGGEMARGDSTAEMQLLDNKR